VLRKHGLYQVAIRDWGMKRDRGMLAITTRKATSTPEVSRMASLAVRRDELIAQKEQADAELASVNSELFELVMVMAETLGHELGEAS
jgi:hypothetical protein